ncbi:uncharacterized protein N7518_009111 [Penicillium psychrosexuale]|uniref:uncharacterized protein n=1 Tax=Penicillium psychrosexuale TaxID=1002107 RepID=UPI0025451F12|nr:uncharacterized protein N7518_009111 [Penicillium psychrosexuale]KAJ5783434.1 hypothetical protein N7518_009111 [Penicillium psychrosexuale]
MSDLRSLSPSVTSELSTSELQVSLNHTLQGYQPLSSTDDTPFFLQIVFKYLPADGQRNLIEDLSGCQDDQEVRQLAESIDTGLLRPMLSTGGKTPAVTPSSRLGLEDSIEYLNTFDVESVTRVDQQRLRQECLARDGYKCAITGTWDMDTTPHPPGRPVHKLQAVHIIPFCLGNFRTDDERGKMSAVWTNIFRWFPNLRSRLNMLLGDVNREDNILMMASVFHEDFGMFHFILEPTTVPNRYRLKKFPRRSCLVNYPTATFITLTNNDTRFRDPNPEFLAVHAAIGNILHASGPAELIEKLLRDFDGADPFLAKDGSTDISSLLSVSCLSLLSSRGNTIQNDEITKAKRRPVQAELQGTENQKPRSNDSGHLPR